MIGEERLRELAAFRGDPVVTSIYVNVDGRRFPRLSDAEPFLEGLLRDARARAAERGDDVVRAVEDAAEKIAARFGEGFDRTHIRGVAFFVAGDFFEVVEVPRPVRNQVALNQVPALRQLEYLVDEFERFLVVLVDRQHARLFRFEMGELVERTEIFDEVPRRVDATDEGGLAASHVQSHVDEVARRHFRHAADVTFHELQEWDADRVILGGPGAAVAEFESQLHPYVLDRVADRVSVPVRASEHDVREAALAVEAEVERRNEAEIVERLKDARGARDGGVTGLADTLRAVYEKRVATLVVSNDYDEPGWRCTECDYLDVKGSTCPMCEASMERIEDVVGEAIDAALLAQSDVEICENVDLDVVGRIGAFLRY